MTHVEEEEEEEEEEPRRTIQRANEKSGVFCLFFLSSFLSFHPGIEAFGDLPFRLIASKKIFFFFFFFFSLAIVSSFCRRLEEEGDGFGKLKSLQGIIYTPRSLTQLCTLILLLLWVLVGWWVLTQWKNHQQSLAAQTLEFLRCWFGKVSGFLFFRCWKESGMFFGF